METEDAGAVVVDDAGGAGGAPEAGSEVEPVVEAVDVLDVLLDPDTEPEFIKALNAQLELDGKKSFSVDPSVLKDQPIEVQQLMVNLRNRTHTATSDAARARQELTANQEQLAADRRKLAEEQSQMVQVWKNPDLMKLIQAPEGDAPDFNREPEKWLTWHSQKQFSEHMTGFMGRLGAVSNESREAVLQAQQSAQEASQIVQIRSFQESHPDFDDHYDEMAALRKVGVDWPLEELYNTVRARKGILPGTEAKQAEEVSPARLARRIVRDRAASTALPATPPELGGIELQDFYDRNPGTRERDVAPINEHGFSAYRS